MAEQQIAPAILGAGGVRFNIYNAAIQAWGGRGDLLEADKFEITPDSENKEKISKSRAMYGQAIASVAIAKPTKIAISIAAASAETLAMQFQGIASEMSQGAATLQAESVVIQLDKWVKLSKRNIVAAGFTVTDTAGTDTYVLGTDYLINYATGEIKALSSGDIAANESVKVTGSALAYSSTLIKGGKVAQVRVQAIYEGVNQVDGQDIECEVYEAVLTSGNGFDFLASDFANIELTGTLVVPPGKDAPYEVRMKHAAV